MDDENNRQELESMLRGTISPEEKSRSIVNIVGLMASASLVGAYAGYQGGRDFELDGTVKVALVVPTVLSGVYMMFGEPKSTSDVERISESRLEVIDLGPMSKGERAYSGAAGFGFAGVTTGMAYCLGYAAGCLVDKF